MNRRQYLNYSLSIVSALYLAPEKLFAQPQKDWPALKVLHSNWQLLAPKNFEIVSVRPRIIISREEQKKRFTPLEVKVLFKEGTENPYSSPYNDETRPGIYTCRACSLPLFSSEMKYDSKTGWPSFFTSIPGHISKKADYKLIWPRIEYHCSKCGTHQGHVFNDGPAPTHERWCNNGVCLTFLAKNPI
jgi:peptide-methionine (R)-S-oxide reductase